MDKEVLEVLKSIDQKLDEIVTATKHQNKMMHENLEMMNNQNEILVSLLHKKTYWPCKLRYTDILLLFDYLAIAALVKLICGNIVQYIHPANPLPVSQTSQVDMYHTPISGKACIRHL